MESAIIGTGDHALLRPYFGLGDNSIFNDSYSEMQFLTADSTEVFTSFSMNYLYGSNADYGNDALDIEDGNLLMYSQDAAARTAYYDSGVYRTIASSSFFGGMADGNGNSTKAQVMQQFLTFLNGDSSPNIIVSSDELDFGTIYPDSLSVQELVVTNFGIEMLSVTNVEITGEGFGYNSILEFDLGHSEQQVLEIEFEIYEQGIYSGELVIFSNDPDTPELLIPLIAECVLPPIIQIEPTAIEIELFNNQIYEDAFTISNLGGTELNCSLVIVDPTREIDWLEMDHNSSIIQPNEFDEIILTFNPDELESGQYFAEMVISHNDPNQNELIIPITMTLIFTEADDVMLANSKLIGNNPNPFNPTTTISFNVTQTSPFMAMEIYNLKGQKIKQLEIRNLKLGINSVIWDGTDDFDKPVSSGIYLYQLKYGDEIIASKKCLLLK